ncbi:MAG: T9SS type A sorting domain-containing protein [Cyclobacteriaceae bacterium]|nr:T9SS type A sorting domain-containing protein [Cyclobacteriaceae bacterium]
MQTKKIAYIALLTLFGFAASAQSLEIVNTDANQKGVIGQDLRTVIKIKNISNKPVYFSISEVKKVIGSSQKSFLCINNDCDNGNIADRKGNISKYVRKLMPGETDESIVAVLESGLVQGISTISYQVFNIRQPADYVQIEMQYEISELSDEGLLYSSRTVDLSNVYPNPVTETAVFDYRIKNDSKEAKIIIHNVLGSVAGEYKLNPFEQQLKVSVESYNPGVYFYSLYIDNEGVATKKLVVRK